MIKSEPSIIDFIRIHGRNLNRQFRPCIFHEAEGGGVTDADLEKNLDEELEFLESDCMTTKEVLKRIFSAEKTIQIDIIEGHATENVLTLIENHLKYGFCVINIRSGKLADANHYMTIIYIDNKTFLIQSYLDHYSYDIKEFAYDNLYRKIVYMFDTEDQKIAKELMGDVQSDTSIDQDKSISFRFYTYDISDLTEGSAISLVKDPTKSYTI